MGRYCRICNEERPKDVMTLYEGKMICQCDLGLPPKKVKFKRNDD